MVAETLEFALILRHYMGESQHDELVLIAGGCTGPGKKTVPRLREFFRQGQAEVVSNSKNKILATWERFFCRALY